jgi:hypothetical protein
MRYLFFINALTISIIAGMVIAFWHETYHVQTGEEVSVIYDDYLVIDNVVKIKNYANTDLVKIYYLDKTFSVQVINLKPEQIISIQKG